MNITDCIGEACLDNYTVCSDGSKSNTSCNLPGSKTVKSLDPCSNSPCNNGTCLPIGDGYSCVCPNGITGTNCDQDINECNENRTICNTGICYNTFGNFFLLNFLLLNKWQFSTF